jgi:hypothetical protein
MLGAITDGVSVHLGELAAMRLANEYGRQISLETSGIASCWFEILIVN